MSVAKAAALQAALASKSSVVWEKESLTLALRSWEKDTSQAFNKSDTKNQIAWQLLPGTLQVWIATPYSGARLRGTFVDPHKRASLDHSLPGGFVVIAAANFAAGPTAVAIVRDITA